MTYDFSLTKDVVNLAGLYESLAVVFDGRIAGISISANQITLHFNDLPSEDDQAQAAAIVAAHDPADLTDAQENLALGQIEVAGLLGQIATQKAALQDAWDNWATLTAAQKDATLKRLVAIEIRELSVWAFAIRHIAFLG